MKILFNFSNVRCGGALSNAADILRTTAYLNKNDEYFVCIPKELKEKLTFLPANFHFIHPLTIKKSSLISFVWEQLFLPFISQRLNVDLLISFNLAVFLSPKHQIVRIIHPIFSSRVNEIAKSAGIKVMARTILLRRLISLSIKKADRVFLVSHSQAKDISEFLNRDLDPKKFKVSYNGLPSKHPQGFPANQLQKAKEELWLFYPALYYRRKNFYKLIEAMAVLKKRRSKKFKLLLTTKLQAIPGKERREIERVVKQEGLKKEIVFLGEIPHSEIGILYDKCDIVVFPSLAETCTLGLIEACLYAKPVVASNISVHREICGQAAVYFNPFDREDMPEKIEKVMDDRPLRQKMVQSGKERLGLFSWEAHVLALYDFIGEIYRLITRDVKANI